MLMLYLYEHYGGRELIRSIVASDALGEHAINAALAADTEKMSVFPEVFLELGSRELG